MLRDIHSPSPASTRIKDVIWMFFFKRIILCELFNIDFCFNSALNYFFMVNCQVLFIEFTIVMIKSRVARLCFKHCCLTARKVPGFDSWPVGMVDVKSCLSLYHNK